MISESKSTRKEVPKDADWIYDGMAVVCAMPTKSTWKELVDTFLEAVTPQEYLHPASIQIIMDTYDYNRIKEMTQTSRGISGRRIFISNEGQTMPQNTNDWNNFLNNGENKTELINFFLRYFSTQKVRSRSKIKLPFTESTNTWEIIPSDINMLFTCNHHEADTRIVLHASRSIKPKIITAPDTDVLVLLTHAYPECNNAKQWLMKTNP